MTLFEIYCQSQLINCMRKCRSWLFNYICRFVTYGRWRWWWWGLPFPYHKASILQETYIPFCKDISFWIFHGIRESCRPCSSNMVATPPASSSSLLKLYHLNFAILIEVLSVESRGPQATTLMWLIDYHLLDLTPYYLLI